MCGICGVVNFDADHAVGREMIENMNRVIAHRGPDDEGLFLERNVGLGMRRLSIIDRSGGRQPIFNEDGSIVIVFNGEVYNYADLTRELALAGHHFKTQSDTEAIVHTYEQYGPECVRELRGMFAFALWDRRRKRLMLARDRLGIKPLYIYSSKSFVAFASEIKALFELPGVPREVDEEALDLYLSLRYVPGPRTMFKNIFKLQPGHFLLLQHGMPRVRKYWDIEYQAHDGRPLNHYVSQFDQLLEESVRLRLIAEVPLGVFLSGGLDSSAILASMSKIRNGERIKAFSVGYKSSSGAEDANNEFEYSRMAASAFQTEHHEYRLDVGDFRDFLPELVWYLDEPLADPSCIPLYFISQLARRHITVVLSGEGADEVLAGYGIYQRMLLLDSFYRSVPLASQIAGALAHLMPMELPRSYVRRAGVPLECRYHGVSRAFRPDAKRALLGQRNGVSPESLVNDLFSSHFNAVRNASPLDRMLYVDAKVWLPDDLLLKADKMTMANSIELRVPFLDHKLVEFTASLPNELKLRRGRGKFLLRQAMQSVLPQPILTRSKKGFPVPTNPWLRGHLRGFTREMLLSPNSACRRHFDARALERIVRENERGVNRHQEVWSLLIFEFWHRVFINRSIVPAAKGDQRLTGVAA